jgi:hypothetical protein
MSLLFAAFATAESSTFATSSAADRSQNCRMVRASATDLPRMRFRTSRAL